MRYLLPCVAMFSLAACSGGATLDQHDQVLAEDLPDCAEVTVSPSYRAEPADRSVDTDDEHARFVVIDGDSRVCTTTFRGLERMVDTINEADYALTQQTPITTPASNPMPGSSVAAPDSNPMPGSPVAAPASNPMPGSSIATPASNALPARPVANLRAGI